MLKACAVRWPAGLIDEFEHRNRDQLRGLQAERDRLKSQLRAVRDSVSYRLGNMLVQAVVAPGRNTALLPYRLTRLCLTEFSRQKRGHRELRPTEDDAPTPGSSHDDALADLDWASRTVASRGSFIRATDVLEIGAGSLERSNDLASAFLDKAFCSLDMRYSEKAMGRVARCADLMNLYIVRADATSTPFADDTFDLVFSIAVGEHIADLELFLREMHRILKPGGEYFFMQGPLWPSVKGHHFLHWKAEVLAVLNEYQHLTLSPDELRMHLRKRGTLPFDIEQCVNAIYFREDLSRLSERETRSIVERSEFVIETWDPIHDDLYSEDKARGVLKRCSKYSLDDLRIKGITVGLRKRLACESD